MSTHSEKWPSWSEVMTYWRELGVPDVEVRPWSPERGHVCRWDDKASFSTSGGFYATTSVQDDTAYHIARSLPKLSEDRRAAFILEAFCRDREFDAFMSGVLSQVPKSDDDGFLLWHSNAKHVIPFIETDWPNAPRYSFEQANRWRDIVARAAETWRALAAGWLVVRVPDLMDPDSTEYAEFLAFLERRRESSERGEYERLRQKFDPPPG